MKFLVCQIGPNGDLGGEPWKQRSKEWAGKRHACQCKDAKHWMADGLPALSNHIQYRSRILSLCVSLTLCHISEHAATHAFDVSILFAVNYPTIIRRSIGDLCTNDLGRGTKEGG